MKHLNPPLDPPLGSAIFAGVETRFNDTTGVHPRHSLTFDSLDREDRLVSLAGKLLSASSGDVSSSTRVRSMTFTPITSPEPV